MSLLNLTNNRTPGNFNAKRQEELLKKERENQQNYIFSKNTILIPKSKIPELKRDFGFFDAFIDRNFTNSDEFFDEDGNYILKKELLPEEMPHYDKETNDTYVITRNQVWNALPKALSDYHIPNRILGDYIGNFFLFKEPKNSLFNPTVPEQNTVSKPNRVYYAGPSLAQLKKQRRSERELELMRRELNGNNNNNNDYPGYLRTYHTINQLKKFIEEDKLKNRINKIKAQLKKNKKENVEELSEALQEIYRNRQLAHALYHTEKAMANRTKYGKESETRKKPLSEKYKEKRKTQRRKKQRARKTAKQSRANNENGNGNYGNGNYGNNEEY